MEILRALALIHPGECSLADLLKSTRRSMQRGACVILITPNLQGGWAADLLQMVSAEITATVLLFDPASYNGTGSPARLVDTLNENGIASHVISRQLLNQPGVHPGQPGKWERWWRVVGPGKVLRRPVDSRWRHVG
jgi:hypothetical protein